MSESILFGTLASGGAAATTGLIGSAGAFSLGTTLGTLGTVASVGGALSSASGVSQSYDANAQAATYNAQVTKQQGAAEELRRRREASRRLSSIRAGIGKSGVTSAGSPLMVLAESAQQAEIDALSAQYTATNSANLSTAKAISAKRAKPYAVGSSLLSSAGTIISRGF